MLKIIQAKYILQQLQFDLIGKDSYRGITLTYTWLANQFGHLALGFIPTILAYQILKNYFNSSHLNLFTAIGISFLWLSFESYNFLGPLLKNANEYVFKPDLVNVAFDTATDICFFMMGAFIAGITIQYSQTLLVIIGTLFLTLTYPSYYWYTTKMYQQEAKFPFQFRLSQWKNKLDENTKYIIHDFVNNTQNGKHLLLFGAYKSGKTSLSVAIANEQSIKHKKALYTSATKLYNLFFEPELSSEQIRITNLWTWRNTDYLIIDDINPSLKMDQGIINPTTFYELLNNKQFGKLNIEVIQKTNIIWVLGENYSSLNDWQDMLISLGIPKKQINTIYL